MRVLEMFGGQDMFVSHFIFCFVNYTKLLQREKLAIFLMSYGGTCFFGTCQEHKLLEFLPWHLAPRLLCKPRKVVTLDLDTLIHLFEYLFCDWLGAWIQMWTECKVIFINIILLTHKRIKPVHWQHTRELVLHLIFIFVLLKPTYNSLWQVSAQ